MNNTYQQPETEINLKEVIWDLLSQWKAVLITALLMALLVCGAKHAKDVKAFNAAEALQDEAASEEQAGLTPEERIAAVLEALPEDEREQVEYVSEQAEMAESMREYLRDSIRMHTDPTNQRRLVQIYNLTANNRGDLAILATIYSRMLQDEDFIKNIAKASRAKASRAKESRAKASRAKASRAIMQLLLSI